MKLLFSNEWAQRTIAADSDVDVSAGMALEDLLEHMDQEVQRLDVKAVLPERNVVQLRVALGTVVRGLRVKHHLSIEELAHKADISEEELRKVEHNPHYTAHPRLISNLSAYFDVALSQLSGATTVIDRTLYNDAVKYAARADDLSTVTSEEREALDAFVALLNERAKSA